MAPGAFYVLEELTKLAGKSASALAPLQELERRATDAIVVPPRPDYRIPVGRTQTILAIQRLRHVIDGADVSVTLDEAWREAISSARAWADGK